jgi:hypothetical protein
MINKKEDWQAIVEQWQQSQKSIELFCKEQKLNLHNPAQSVPVNPA